MSVVIKLQHLPVTATSHDIRQFFRSLSIPDGGVHIVGGTEGDVFIIFSTDEDARQAMLLNGSCLKDSPVRLSLSSGYEMTQVIEQTYHKALRTMKSLHYSVPSSSHPPVPAPSPMSTQSISSTSSDSISLSFTNTSNNNSLPATLSNIATTPILTPTFSSGFIQENNNNSNSIAAAVLGQTFPESLLLAHSQVGHMHVPPPPLFTQAPPRHFYNHCPRYNNNRNNDNAKDNSNPTGLGFSANVNNSLMSNNGNGLMNQKSVTHNGPWIRPPFGPSQHFGSHAFMPNNSTANNNDNFPTRRFTNRIPNNNSSHNGRRNMNNNNNNGPYRYRAGSHKNNRRRPPWMNSNNNASSNIISVQTNRNNDHSHNN